MPLFKSLFISDSLKKSPVLIHSSQAVSLYFQTLFTSIILPMLKIGNCSIVHRQLSCLFSKSINDVGSNSICWILDCKSSGVNSVSGVGSVTSKSDSSIGASGSFSSGVTGNCSSTASIASSGVRFSSYCNC